MRGPRKRGVISDEEMRIYISAVAGPRRVHINSFKPFNISLTSAQSVARNGSAPSLYVEVRWLSGPTVVVVGTSKNLGPENSKRVDFADEPFIGTVLLEGEELWIKGTTPANAPTRIQAGEIQV